MMPKKWNWTEQELVRTCLREGMTSWQTARKLEDKLGRSKRSIDSMARRLSDDVSVVRRGKNA